MHFLLILENSKIYIRTYIKIAATCFGVQPSSGSLNLSLAKVTHISLGTAHSTQHTHHTRTQHAATPQHNT
jgi:hypothetical protein